MKRALIVVGPPLIVFVVLFLLFFVPSNGISTGIPAQVADESGDIELDDIELDDDFDTDVDLVTGDHPSAPAETRLAQVERLADGDSFDIRWLDTGESDEVRLFGINAPEGTACFGDVSRDVLQALTSDQELLIESIGRDDFGRVLGNVWVGSVFINLRLVEQGAALALTDNSAYGQIIRDAQSAAQSSGAGLWDATSCGASDASDQAQLLIAEIFENAPGLDNENPNGEWIDITNAGATNADLSDWSIRDESTRHRFFFPDGFFLDAGRTVRVFSGCGDDDATSLYWCDGDPVWNNTGDTAFLVDPDGRFVDTLTYAG